MEIEEAINKIDENSGRGIGRADGKWLERLTAKVAPHIKEWDVSEAWMWAEWDEREAIFPDTTNQDIGIDVVAKRRGDGEYIAIQCKSRQLDENGQGRPIGKSEVDTFLSTSVGQFWSERWIVTNGNNRLGGNVDQALSMHDRPLKLINIRKDLSDQQQLFADSEECAHCQPDANPESVIQTKSCMQNEAVAESVRILREHEVSDSGGLPVGQARGKIILPCGTGKTRISLRIVEKLTSPGELAVVLCPSIALVAQIRREYLQHANVPIRALAVCSDETAGYNPRREDAIDTSKNPTADNSNFSASDVKGKVTTDAAEISRWISSGKSVASINVVFGTYQSGHRVATALQTSKTTAKVLIADEAHRTAGFKRRASKSEKAKNEEREIRNFTLCHDNEAFPAIYRVYQTATPKVFDIKPARSSKNQDWIVRSMDDESVFGVELYRKSYPEAVRNEWLSDYRIIALGINDPEAYRQANLLASGTEITGRNKITSSQYLRALAFALAMGGATQGGEEGDVAINSCIAFMNTVAKSKEVADRLQTAPVRQWVQDWLHSNSGGQSAKDYKLEHLDATSKVLERDAAKLRLAEANRDTPHGIINVGIFGEGTDSPSLSAVAFLEARKSPIDVIQAVGRAMRTAPNKAMGYIICPILIPPDADPESWLSTSDMEEGWQELGQILLALRAHDQRIEDELSDLLQIYLPSEPEQVKTIVAVANRDSSRIQYREHVGKPGDAEKAVASVLEGKTTLAKEFTTLPEHYPSPSETDSNLLGDDPQLFGNAKPEDVTEPTQIISGKMHSDGNTELRVDTVARDKAKPDGTRGAVNVEKSKAKAKKMINEGAGIRKRTTRERNKPREREEIRRDHGMQMLLLSGLGEHGDAIKMNLLAKSGLSANRVLRDLNILEESISEAAFHLRSDETLNALNQHFGIDNLKKSDQAKQADGSTIASLLIMNAAMLHQRIANGRWLSGVSDLEVVKNDANVVRRVTREWNKILSYDFRPVIEPAIRAIEAVEDTGKTAGLERALRHIAAEAERIAETYADMGADHAGPLFNKVMGNQASDGAFFTRPTAASLAARLTLDVCEPQDWTDPDVWRAHKTVDLACGSGTLLTAMLTDMKRRAKEQGADDNKLAELQRIAVEEVLKGMDINAVSLQLAAAQLTAGNKDIRYRSMGLHLMSYGPHPDDPNRVSAGSLELLGQRTIVSRPGEMEIPDDAIGSQGIWESDSAELEDAVDAAKDARIVIMNPPFTNRTNMGQKFSKDVQQKLRSRVDSMEQILVSNDGEMNNFVDKNSVRPLFVALADRALEKSMGGGYNCTN